MYPQTYFGLFPPFPREDKVFVAMGFDAQFDFRWKYVIAPAIGNVDVGGKQLKPHRVDARVISDSILTEILGGIANDRVIFADVSTIGYDEGRPIRNANVMYEVGLAHACRLPEEVILFRSDSDDLLFDLANVNINRYHPDDRPDEATLQLSKAIKGAVQEVDLKRELAVKAAAGTLDFPSSEMLSLAAAKKGLHHFPSRTMGQALGNAANNAAIVRLLELGALTTEYLTVTPEILSSMGDQPSESILQYKITSFGLAILKYTGTKMNLMAPEVISKINESFGLNID